MRVRSPNALPLKRTRYEARLELIRNGPPELPKIEAPTRIRWDEHAVVLKGAWADLMPGSGKD